MKKKPLRKGIFNDHSHNDAIDKDHPCCRGRLVIKSGQPRLGTNKEAEHNHPDDCQKPCCRRHLVDMLGRGRPEFPIPSEQKVLQDVQAMLASGSLSLDGDPESEVEEADGIRSRKPRTLGDIFATVKKMKSADDKGSGGPGTASAGRSGRKGGRKLKANANANRVASEVIRLCFFDERWKATVAKKFNPSRNTLRRARKLGKYIAGIDSLDNHFGKLRELYKSALPKAFDMVTMQFPDSPEGERRAAAVQLIDQQEDLQQILYVLDHYVQAFEQLDDPEYAPLQAVTVTVEEAFNLFLTGDIEAARGKAQQALADTVNFMIGNSFLPHAGEDGPATIPGASGPVGLHLILVPEDEVGIIMLMMVLYLHEFRHDIFADIKGLAEEEGKALLSTLRDASTSGRLKLSVDHIMLGKTKVPMIDLISKVFLDELGEIDADLVALELSGWAFALNMLYVFGAFNSKRAGAIRTKELLRTNSYFQVSKKGELWFEPHPVDYFRVYMLAAALELLGFKEEAQEIRDLADSAVGSKKPEFIIWEDASGKRDPIKIRMSDLVQAAPIVAEAILMTPFAALKGKSNHDIVAWTRKRQDKVDMLVDALVKHIKSVLAGEDVKLELPAGVGDVYATYVAAAAAIAFYQLIADGEVDPTDVPQLVNTSSLQMLQLSMQRLTDKMNDLSVKKPEALIVPSSVKPPVTEPAPEPPPSDPLAPQSGSDRPGKLLSIRYEAPRKKRSARKQ